MGRKKKDNEVTRDRNPYTVKAEACMNEYQSSGDPNWSRRATANLTRAMMTDQDLSAFFDEGFYRDLICGYGIIAANRAGLSRGQRETLERELLWTMDHYKAATVREILEKRKRGEQ